MMAAVMARTTRRKRRPARIISYLKVKSPMPLLESFMNFCIFSGVHGGNTSLKGAISLLGLIIVVFILLNCLKPSRPWYRP